MSLNNDLLFVSEFRKICKSNESRASSNVTQSLVPNVSYACSRFTQVQVISKHSIDQPCSIDWYSSDNARLIPVTPIQWATLIFYDSFHSIWNRFISSICLFFNFPVWGRFRVWYRDVTVLGIPVLFKVLNCINIVFHLK